MRYHFFKLAVLLILLPLVVTAAPLNLSDTPISLTKTVSPLTMLVMGRDHKLYYEAYNDASDINNDGVVDIRFKPNIVYYGYFDSFKCYDYSGGTFVPVSATLNSDSGGTECRYKWSGNFLNYLTTSRIDALRKVLYGGYRLTDRRSETILERSYIPQDAHSWGKSYTSPSVDGYNISYFTPFGTPHSGRRHLFANTTLRQSGDGSPLLRVALNMNYQIWEWLSIERPVAGDYVATGNNHRTYIGSSISDYKVRVKVCVPNLLEKNCQAYRDGSNVRYKPVGILQELGENEQMKFGLLTGSYGKNLSGGVLRKNIDLITDEIDMRTGRFRSTNGIIRTLDRLKITGFGDDYYYNSNCGWIFTRDIIDGECRMWGNPVAEMMYESVRYFAGKKSPTRAFEYSGGDDDALGLPKPNWKDPYDKSENPWCAKPNILLISDIYPSYDTDQVPGSAFSSFSGDLSPSLNAQSLADTIWQNEIGGAGNYFIGESLSDSNRDGAPTGKTVTSFGNIRGLVPEEPNKAGGYYSASVAYYGWKNDVNQKAKNEQKIHTFSVALASPLPEIIIPINGKKIKLIPFAKSVGGCYDVSADRDAYQPTNTIVDFYVEELKSDSGTFRINFEDAQQGADHDMDAIVKYHYKVNPNNSVTITLDSTYAGGCIIQHMGYVISGTTQDGVYLEVRDRDTAEQDDPDYHLDTPNNRHALPLHAERTFIPGTTDSAKLLKNPLWYAAKWGGFDDLNNNQVPDSPQEYDKDGDGVPDNYFLVTNALTLKDRLTQVFKNIIKRASSHASAAVSSGILSDTTTVFQALFDSNDWTGHLVAYRLDPQTGQVLTNGPAFDGAKWDVAEQLAQQDWQYGRNIMTYRTDSGYGIPFVWGYFNSDQYTMLRNNPVSGSTDSWYIAYQRWQYLRGYQGQEESRGGSFRDRKFLLGDIIDSSPLYVGRPQFTYLESWPEGAKENQEPYSKFKSSNVANRPSMLYVGANDGMLHAIDVDTGRERFAYIPSPVFKNLNYLTSPDYKHKFFVNAQANYADVFINGQWKTVLIGGLGRGGKGIYALDITNPGNVNERYAYNTVLWEFNQDMKDSRGQLIARDLGYTYGKPAIVRLASGQWAAIFGNGYNNTEGQDASTTGNAVLYIVDIETGKLIKSFDTHVGMAEDPDNSNRPNGLSTPAVVDANGDYIADVVYAGDMFGNLWKFDISNKDPAQWKIGLNGQPLFVAKKTIGRKTHYQPITTRPTVSRVPNKPGVFQIYFGTGKFLESKDKTNLDLQSFYAVQDDNSDTGVLLSQLKKQEFYNEFTLTENGQAIMTARSSSSDPVLSEHRGWYIDLMVSTMEGERVISDPIIRREKLIFTTMIPRADPCEAGGDGWLVELNAVYGTPLPYAPFDLDGDRNFTSRDYEIQGNKKVSAKKSTVGIISTPAIISDKNREFKLTSGSTGRIESTVENPGLIREGRQSWQQIK